MAEITKHADVAARAAQFAKLVAQMDAGPTREQPTERESATALTDASEAVPEVETTAASIDDAPSLLAPPRPLDMTAHTRANQRYRRYRIVQLVKHHAIHRQADLKDRLVQEGIPVTQATVSRDIKALGLVWHPSIEGGAHQYALPDDQVDLTDQALGPLIRQGLVTVKRQRQFVALSLKATTQLPQGSVNLAEQVNRAHLDGVLIAVGQRDAALVVCDTPADARALVALLQQGGDVPMATEASDNGR